jgi:hypothetical protein
LLPAQWKKKEKERECVCDEAGERKREILFFLKEKNREIMF